MYPKLMTRHRCTYRLQSQAGFTLIELLVVIALLTALIGTLAPSLEKVKQSAATLEKSKNAELAAVGGRLAPFARTTANNLKQMSIAVANYRDTERRAEPVEPKVEEEVKGWLRSLCEVESASTELMLACASGQHHAKDRELEALKAAEAALERIESETVQANRRALAELSLRREEVCAGIEAKKRR